MPPLPQPTSLTQPFWDAVREGRLIVPECADCATRFFVPEPLCVACGSANWTWQPSDGVGEIYSLTIVHQPISRDQPAPFALAAVDLDDGWTIMTHILTDDMAQVRIGARVRLSPTRVNDEISLPTFALID